MTNNVLIAERAGVDPAAAAALAPAGSVLTAAPFGTPGFRAALAETEFLVGLGEAGMDDAFYRSAPRLKLVQLLSAGYDRCDIEAARRARVPIANNGGANSVAVAEHAMMLMLALSCRLVWQHESVAAGRWRGNDFSTVRLTELNGKTVGIVGLGTIGRKVARLSSAFGMRVIYYDIMRLPEDAADALGISFRLMPELLAEADFVSLHVPLSPSTRQLIGRPELERMKPGAFLVNTCRGPVVDEAALIEALSAGRIAGAGLDVFDQEPPPSDNKLFLLDNVVLTPHLAGPTQDNQITRFRNAFDNVQRVARGEPPLWVIPELRG